MLNKLELVTRVKTLLSNPAKWTKGSFARDSIGNGVDFRSESATCFCIRGAARHEAAAMGFDALTGDYTIMRIMEENMCINGEAGVASFNDNPSTTHEDVMKALDCAIEVVKS